MINFRSRKAQLLTLAMAAVVGVLFIVHPASAQTSTTGLWDTALTTMYNIVGTIVLMVIQALATLLAQVIHLLIILAQYNNFIHNPIVDRGWNIVMDVTNMIFIIALLVIAFGTVLRIQNYRYNSLLGNVIIMAFLTNFSRTIAGFFIQTSQVFMLTFVNAFRDAAFGNFATMFGLDKLLTFASTKPPEAHGQLIASMLIGLLLVIVALIVMISLTMVVAVRIVMLWILVILSPAAYALRILPNTKEFASQWWKEFGKWTVNGPIIAFFIWLALAVMSQSAGDQTVIGSSKWITDQQSIKDAITRYDNSGELNLFFGNTELLEIDNFISFIIGIIFMMMALQYSVSMGGVAGKWAGKVAAVGFGAYGTISLLNAVRDRTVAPIQGYMQQRDARRKQGIAERSAWVGSKVDLAANVTTGVAGRGMASIGAFGKAVSRGQFTGAGGAAIAALQTGTRGQRQRDMRAEQYRMSKAATDATETDYSQLDEARVRGLAVAGSSQQRFNAIKHLIETGALQREEPRDVQLFKQAAGYAGKRKEGQKFIKDAAAIDAQLVRHAQFGDITDRGTQEKILEAIKNHTVGTDILSSDDGAYLTANAAVGQEFADTFWRTARNAAELKKRKEGLGANADGILQHMDLTGQDIDTRRMVSEATGQLQRTFRDGAVLDRDALQKFVKSRGGKISDIVAAVALRDGETLEALDTNLSEKEILETAGKSDNHEDALKAGLADARAKQITRDKKVIWKTSETGYAEQEKYRRAEFKINGGKKSVYELGTGNADSEESFRRMAKSLKAKEIAKITENEKYDSTKTATYSKAYKDVVDLAIGQRMAVAEIGELAARGGKAYDLAERSVKAAVKKGTITAGSPPPSKAEQKRAQSLEKSEVTSSMV